MTELRERVIAGKVKPIPPGTYSPELVGLMHGLLTLTPARRPTLTAILTMPQVRLCTSHSNTIVALTFAVPRSA